MKCSQCGICCSLFLINLTEKEYKSRNYKTQFGRFGIVKDFKEAEMCGANIISQKKNDECIYLKNSKCSIHEKRPEACRKFFCSSKRTQFKDMIKIIKNRKKSIL